MSSRQLDVREALKSPAENHTSQVCSWERLWVTVRPANSNSKPCVTWRKTGWKELHRENTCRSVINTKFKKTSQCSRLGFNKENPCASLPMLTLAWQVAVDLLPVTPEPVVFPFPLTPIVEETCKYMLRIWAAALSPGHSSAGLILSGWGRNTGSLATPLA